MNFEFLMNSHEAEVYEAFEAACERALEKCGLVAEGFAKKLAPVDTGALRNSISHKVVDKDAYVGTNQEYAAYVEFGTGQYATQGGGRNTPWVYQDAKGHWHKTSGSKAQPFVKPAVADHVADYRQIVEGEFKGG